MSTVREPIAVVCSDVHLSHTPPACRAVEPDWYAAMARSLAEPVLACGNELPLIVAGDLFDKWNPPPELINFAMSILGRVETIAVPGQHDLPYHNLSQIEKSAFGTLMKAGFVRYLSPESPYRGQGFTLHGFPWGVPVEPIIQPDGKLHAAIVHRMIWQGDAKHQGAGTHEHVAAYEDRLRGFDAAIFGDNHQGFEARCGKCFVYNSGNLMIRSRKDGPGSYGILYSDGTIERREISPVHDHIDRGGEASHQEANEEIERFVGELQKLSSEKIDFVAAVNDFIQTARDPVRQLLSRLLDECGQRS